MRRTFNFTNRQKIAAADLAFELKRDDDGRRSFEGIIDLRSIDVPDHAKVYVEAYHARSLARFDFGTAAQICEPESRYLDDVDFDDRLQFRVKVVDESGDFGRILATTTGLELQFDPQPGGSRIPLLPVSYSNHIGSEVWRLKFLTAGPLLEVNNGVPGIRDIVERDPGFGSLVRPQLIRSILGRILLNEDGVPDAEMDTWEGRWLLFAQSFSTSALDSDANNDDREEWIDEVVAGFAGLIQARATFADTFTDRN